jgi:hypothetical protein
VKNQEFIVSHWFHVINGETRSFSDLKNAYPA